MKVGEYADDHGFPPPNSVSIRREYSRSRFRIEWSMQKLQKIEDTWCSVLWYFDTEYDSTQRAFEGWWQGWHAIYSFATAMTTSTSRTCTSTTVRFTSTGTGSTTTGTLTTPRCCSQPSSFLSRFFIGRVLFLKLPDPSAEHFSDFVQVFGKHDIFFIVDRLRFPKYH